MYQNGFKIDIHKTDKITIDEQNHVLPPSRGVFSEYKVADYFCPDEWSKDGIFIAIEENMPLWFDFRGNDECACIPSVQRLNPITGEPANLEDGLKKEPSQNYLVLPAQKWLDGYAKDGKVYQFVVTKAGAGLAVNEYVLPKYMQDSHALGFAFFSPKNPKSKTLKQYLPYHEVLIGSSNYSYCDPLIKSRTVRSATQWESHSLMPNDCNSGQMATYDNVSVILSTTMSNPTASVNVGSVTDAVYLNALSVGVESSSITDNVVYAENVSYPEEHRQDLDQAAMGMGGRIIQEITTDNNTVAYYKDKPDAILTIYLSLPDMFDSIMKKGKRQDINKKDRFKVSGDIAGIPVPLI